MHYAVCYTISASQGERGVVFAVARSRALAERCLALIEPRAWRAWIDAVADDYWYDSAEPECRAENILAKAGA